MPGFSNKSIVAPVKGLPHICLRDGWWRVSPWIKGQGLHNWTTAHAFANVLNNRRRANESHRRKRAKANQAG